MKIVRVDYDPDLWAVIDDQYPEGDSRNVRYTAPSKNDCDIWTDGYYAAQSDFGG